MHDRRLDSPVAPLWLFMLLPVIWLFALPAQAQDAAARVLHVAGQVYVSSEDGARRRLNRGDEIYAGDTLESSTASSAQLLFSDNGRMAVRADTIVRIVEYRYDADNRENSRSFVTLLGGAVRTITGLIGQFNKNRVLLTTPVAKIGIRGTDHEAIYIQPGSAKADDNAQAGTYNIVYSGATVLRSAGGVLLLDRNDIGFVADAGAGAGAPLRIDSLPKSVEDMLVFKVPDRTRRADLRAGGTDRDQLSAAGQEINAAASGRILKIDAPGRNAVATGIANSSFGISKAPGRDGRNAPRVAGSFGHSTGLPPGKGLIKPPQPPKPPKLPGPPRGNNGNR